MTPTEVITPVIISGDNLERLFKNKAIKQEVIQRLVTTILEKEDRELADAIRALTWKAIHEADMIMEYGPSSERFALIKTMVTNAARLIGATSSSNIEEGRVALSSLLEGMRSPPPQQSAPTQALTPTTDDSD